MKDSPVWLETSTGTKLARSCGQKSLTSWVKTSSQSSYSLSSANVPLSKQNRFSFQILKPDSSPSTDQRGKLAVIFEVKKNREFTSLNTLSPCPPWRISSIIRSFFLMFKKHKKIHFSRFSRMVRVIKQGEYTTTIYKLIADGDYSEAGLILER